MDFGDLMRAEMAEKLGSGDDWKALTAEEIENIDWFQPIKDLKPGDVLKPREYARKNKVNAANSTVSVHRVGDFSAPREEGSPINREDFSILVRINDAVVEIAEDSRNWERA